MPTRFYQIFGQVFDQVLQGPKDTVLQRDKNIFRYPKYVLTDVSFKFLNPVDNWECLDSRKLHEQLPTTLGGNVFFRLRDVQVAIYTVVDEESESAVRIYQTQRLGTKI